VTFQRRDPQTYVVLVARAGPEGVLLGTQHFKPAGTEFATELDLFEAGFARADVLAEALSLLPPTDQNLVLDRYESCGPAEGIDVRARIAAKLREEACRLNEANRESG
jgi:hypothetical protein